MLSSMDSLLRSIGKGPFQSRLMVCSAVYWSSDAMEVMVLSMLLPTIHEQWGISRTRTALLGIFTFAGVLFGALFFGMISDRIGRRPVVIMAAFLTGVCGLLSACVSANDSGFNVLILCRTAVGMGVSAASVSFAMLTEFTPTKLRVSQLARMCYAWSVGGIFCMVAGLLTLPLVEGWRIFLVVVALPQLAVSVLCYKFLPESPRWLLSSGRKSDAIEILQQAATTNGHDKFKEEDFDCLEEASGSGVHSAGIVFGSPSLNTAQGGLMVKLPLMFKLSTVIMFAWMLVGSLYYFIVLLAQETAIRACPSNSTHRSEKLNVELDNQLSPSTLQLLSSNQQSKVPMQFCSYWYFVSISTAIAELPGVYFGALIMNRLGRRYSWALLSIQCTAACIVLASLSFAHYHSKMRSQNDQIPIIESTVLLMLARMAAVSVFNTVYILTSEAYPPAIKATALGIASSASRVSGMFVAPIMAAMSITGNYFLSSVIAAFLVLLAYWCPLETRDPNSDDSGLEASGGDTSHGVTPAANGYKSLLSEGCALLPEEEGSSGGERKKWGPLEDYQVDLVAERKCTMKQALFGAA